jgi:hypothetical protein
MVCFIPFFYLILIDIDLLAALRKREHGSGDKEAGR